MKEQIEKIKIHLKYYKKFYIGVGVGSVAAFTCIIMREQLSGKVHINEHTDSGKTYLNGYTNGVILNDRTVFSLFGKVISNDDHVVNVLEREGRGHPGYLVQHKETGVVYS